MLQQRLEFGFYNLLILSAKAGKAFSIKMLGEGAFQAFPSMGNGGYNSCEASFSHSHQNKLINTQVTFDPGTS